MKSTLEDVSARKKERPALQTYRSQCCVPSEQTKEAMVLAPNQTIPRPLRIPLMPVFTTLARNSQRGQLIRNLLGVMNSGCVRLCC
jgi:hypothetical protein